MTNEGIELVIKSQRKIEGLINKLSLGNMTDFSFHEAIDICHWLNRRVRPVGKDWYITAGVIDGRYALRRSSGGEYYTTPSDIFSRWEVL